MEDSRSWRIYPSDLDQGRKNRNNVCRLEVQIGNKEIKCRSIKNQVVSGGLTSQRRADKELDTRLWRPKINNHYKQLNNN